MQSPPAPAGSVHRVPPRSPCLHLPPEVHGSARQDRVPLRKTRRRPAPPRHARSCGSGSGRTGNSGPVTSWARDYDWRSLLAAVEDHRRSNSPSPCGRGQAFRAKREMTGGGEARGTPPPICTRFAPAVCPLPQGEGGYFVQAAHAFIRASAISAAIWIAAIMLRASALPWPAISSAVPWSGEVRTIGSPKVTFTPSQKLRLLIGISAWS